MTANPSLRSTELHRIHGERQSAIIATVLQELPDPIPKHCLNLLRHAPESFDDLRYGTLAQAAFNLHLNHHPVSILTVQEELARNPAQTDLSDIFQFMSLRPMALPSGILEWECEELWNAYSFRRKATLYDEASRSMLAHPDQSDSIDRHVRRALAELDVQRNGDKLPEIIDAHNLLATDMQLPQLLIESLLHKGSKMSLGGGSKTFKSWTFLSIGHALSTGTKWLGFQCPKARVLILNFEIGEAWIRHRLQTICQAAQLYPPPGSLDFWNLRGCSAPHATIIPKIIARAKALKYDLIIIDPSYKLIGQGDENSACDVAAMMNSFEMITVETGASVLFGAHFAKGNSSAKEAIDRISGSGVFARDPDTILTFTPHEQPDCFTVEATLRNLPQLDPFVVQWRFPAFERQPELDPGDLKKKAGRPKISNPDELLGLASNPISTRAWQKAAYDELNLSRATFYRLKNQLEQTGQITYSKIDNLWHPNK